MHQKFSIFNWLILYTIGLILPFIYLSLVLLSGIPVESAEESGKYISPAVGLLTTGALAVQVDGQWQPLTERLPGYPYFLALLYWFFGQDNHTAIAIVQCFIGGLIVVGIALVARAIRPSWTWPAGLLAAFWPNLQLRTSILMPELIFVLFLVWGLAGCLWAVRRKPAVGLLCGAGILFGLAFITRPAMLYFPLFALPPFIHLVRKETCLSWGKSLLLAFLPFLIMWSMATPQLLRTYHHLGEAAYSTQSGEHALFWTYQCLNVPLGCGNRDPQRMDQTARLLQHRLSNLTPEQRQNPIVVNRVKHGLAMELVRNIPIPQLISAVLGAATKLLLQNSFYEVMTRFGETEAILYPRLSQASILDMPSRLLEFIQDASQNGWMRIWLLFTIFLLVSRAIQVSGLLLGIATPPLQARLLFIVSSSFNFVFVSLGIGNPRYRAPFEPALVILTVAGWSLLWHRYRYGKLLAA